MNKYIFIVLISIFCSIPSWGLEDELVNSTLTNIDLLKPEVYIKYNYQSYEKIPVKLSIKETIKSNKVFEGQIVEFVVQENVVDNDNIIINEGEIIPARIETVTSSGMNGIPASIVIGNFEFNPEIKSKIINQYEVQGQDRSLLVFPLKWALTILPPTGTLTNFIMGGNAKLKPKKIIKLYYYPKWI